MKKVNNKLYPSDWDSFERKARGLIIGALVADIAAAIMLAATMGMFYTKPIRTTEVKVIREQYVEEKATEADPLPTTEQVEEAPVEEPEVMEPVVEESPVVYMTATDAEIELLALVTMAEAEGEPVEGKRLVIDTVLNRVDSPRWPNTISEVIYQPNQFVAMSNGRAERCVVTDEVRQLVREELLSRTNTEVVYFTAGGYGRYGTPVFSVGNHYFCK